MKFEDVICNINREKIKALYVFSSSGNKVIIWKDDMFSAMDSDEYMKSVEFCVAIEAEEKGNIVKSIYATVSPSRLLEIVGLE